MKKILISFLTIISISTFGQVSSSSKIIKILNESLKINKIDYHTNETLLRDFFTANSATFENDALFEDYEGNTKYTKAFNINLKNNYSILGSIFPTNITFYFDESILKKCSWNFETTFKKSIKLQKELSIFIKNHDDYGAGILWFDKYSSLRLNRGQLAQQIQMDLVKGDSSDLTLETEMPFSLDFTMKDTAAEIIPIVNNSKPKSPREVLENLINKNKNGNGFSAFTLQIIILEDLIKSGKTLSDLEKQFGEWTSYGSDNSIGYEYDEKTKDHTIPIYNIQYETTIKKRYYVIRTEVKNNIKNKISYVEIITELNGIQLAEFKKSLGAKGYLINENLTSIFRKQTWQNKSKNTMVTIKENMNGTYSIGIR